MKSEEWRKRSWYGNPIKGSIAAGESDDIELFEDLDTTPRTTPGTSAAWFCTRGYSFGSSTSDAVLNTVKKHPEPSPEEEENEEDSAIIAAAKPIIIYIGNNSNAHQEEEQAENEEEEGGETITADPELLVPQATAQPDNVAGGEALEPLNNHPDENEEVEIPNMNYEHGSIEQVKHTLQRIKSNPTETDYVSTLKFDISPELTLDDQPEAPIITDEVRIAKRICALPYIQSN
jgi:hypothetical protein